MTRSVSRSASSNTSRSGTARSRNEPTSSPVNAPNPPGQNFTPNVHPSPASSRVYLRVQTPVTQPQVHPGAGRRGVDVRGEVLAGRVRRVHRAGRRLVPGAGGAAARGVRGRGPADGSGHVDTGQRTATGRGGGIPAGPSGRHQPVV